MSQYISSLTPLRAAILTSGISSSVFFIGNLTHAWFGAVPIVQSKGGEVDPPLTDKQKADLWLFFYDRAKIVFVSAAATSTVSFAATAYLTRNDDASRALASVAAVTSGLIVPWTVVQMLPVNKQLESVSKTGEERKAAYVGALVEKWRRAHNVRLLLGGISYLVALVLATTL